MESMIETRGENFSDPQLDDEDALENTTFQTVLKPFRVLINVLFNGQEPRKISLIYLKNCMRVLGILPHFWRDESLVYTITFIFIIVSMTLFAATITCDLYEASQDIVQFGEDLVVLIGIYLVIVKLLLFAYNGKDIERIIYEFDKLGEYFSQLQESANLWKIRKLQRLFLVVELTSHAFYVNLSVWFTAVMCLSPFLTHTGGTPYRAKFPFVLKTFAETPILFSSIYTFQSIMTFFTLMIIVLIDGVGCYIISQTTLHLKIFCIRIIDLGSLSRQNRLEELHKIIKFHQYFISLVTKINNVFYYNYVCQMAASTLMICLTAFEATLTQDKPLLAIKFQFFMFSAFLQLFYWCTAGNMVYYNSLEIADAAYQIDRWYEQSKEFGYCLRFLIKRSQTPLIYRPRPFFSFNYETFVSILSTSYSYFTLLRTMND